MSSNETTCGGASDSAGCNPVPPGSVRISAETRVVGVIGYPVEHSLSPQMHNAAFRALGMNWCYLAFSVKPDDLPAALAAVPALGLAGLNVTIPHKQAAARLVSELDTAARITGAVNTISCFERRLAGYNTDAAGFSQALAAAGFEAAGCRAVVLGAGGAARAIVVALAEMRAERVQVIARRRDAAQQVSELVVDVPGTGTKTRGEASEWSGRALQAACGSSDLLVNATPIGMYPDHDAPPPVEQAWLRQGMWVCDLVYRPVETRLTVAARQRGCHAVNGVGMLVHQGALAFKLWTGRDAPLQVMRDALLAELREPQAAGE